MGKTNKKQAVDDDSSEDHKPQPKSNKKVIKMARRIDKGTGNKKKQASKGAAAKNSKKNATSKVTKSKLVGKSKKSAKKASSSRARPAGKSKPREDEDSSDSESEDENKIQVRKLPGQRYPAPEEVCYQVDSSG